MGGEYHVLGLVCVDDIGVRRCIVKNFFTFFIVFSVGLACCVAIYPRAGSIVASTDLE